MKRKKGDDKMEHKDLWLVIGLTVILAVTVSLSTVSLTGDAIFMWGNLKTTGASQAAATGINACPTCTLSSLYNSFHITPDIVNLYNAQGPISYTDSDVLMVRALSRQGLTDKNLKSVNSLYVMVEGSLIKIFADKNGRATEIYSQQVDRNSSGMNFPFGFIISGKDKVPLFLQTTDDNGFKLLIGDNTYIDERTSIYFRESGTNRLRFLGNRPTGGTYQPNDVVISYNDNSQIDISSYDRIDVLTQFGIKLKSPRSGIENDDFRFEVPK